MCVAKITKYHNFEFSEESNIRGWANIKLGLERKILQYSQRSQQLSKLTPIELQVTEGLVRISMLFDPISIGLNQRIVQLKSQRHQMLLTHRLITCSWNFQSNGKLHQYSSHMRVKIWMIQ